MTKTFEAAPFVFAVDDGYTAVELEDGVEIAFEDFDARFEPTPVASWVLARLVAMIDRTSNERALLLSRDTVEHIEDGLYVVDFVVSKDGEVVAKVQLQGGAIGVGLLGMARDGLGAPIADALAAALLAATDDLAEAEVRIADPNDGDRIVRHGWDGKVLLT